jgi:1,4-dihydroxy-2-naphthoyl-CoA hydrolase
LKVIIQLPFQVRIDLIYDYRTRRGVAQLGSAPVWGAGGRRFKSYRPDHLKKLFIYQNYLKIYAVITLLQEKVVGIWTKEINLEIVQQRSEGTMLEYLGIVFTAVGDDFLRATMPVDERTKQPIGIMHGGASCVLAESVGSTAGNFCIKQDNTYCVGLDINTNHICSIREGIVIATASPFHLGRSTQVWDIQIKNEQGKLISVTRLTLAVLENKP